MQATTLRLNMRWPWSQSEVSLRCGCILKEQSAWPEWRVKPKKKVEENKEKKLYVLSMYHRGETRSILHSSAWLWVDIERHCSTLWIFISAVYHQNVCYPVPYSQDNTYFISYNYTYIIEMWSKFVLIKDTEDSWVYCKGKSVSNNASQSLHCN